MRDLRDPELIGKKLQVLREQHPDMSAAERADLLEAIYDPPHLTNGDGK